MQQVSVGSEAALRQSTRVEPRPRVDSHPCNRHDHGPAKSPRVFISLSKRVMSLSRTAADQEVAVVNTRLPGQIARRADIVKRELLTVGVQDRVTKAVGPKFNVRQSSAPHQLH